jgi:hypothetical protein
MGAAESRVGRVGEVGTAECDEESCDTSVQVRVREMLMI